jgi:hypothetical protein
MESRDARRWGLLMHQRGAWLASLFCLLAVAGCGDDDHDHDHDDHDHDPVPGHDHPDAACEGDELSWAAGTEASGARWTVRIVSAAPQPHVTHSRDNAMTVAILDGEGNPVEGADLAVEPITTSHGGHGTHTDHVVAEGADGQYEITGLSYVHAGTWLVHFDITSDGESERVSMKLCVEPGDA